MNEEFLNGQSRSLRIEKAAVPPSRSSKVSRRKSRAANLAPKASRETGSQQGQRLTDKGGQTWAQLRQCDEIGALASKYHHDHFGLRAEWNEIVAPGRAKSPLTALARNFALPSRDEYDRHDQNDASSAVARNGSVLKANT